MKDATGMPQPPESIELSNVFAWRAGGRGKQDESPKVAIYLFSACVKHHQRRHPMWRRRMAAHSASLFHDGARSSCPQHARGSLASPRGRRPAGRAGAAWGLGKEQAASRRAGARGRSGRGLGGGRDRRAVPRTLALCRAEKSNVRQPPNDGENTCEQVSCL